MDKESPYQRSEDGRNYVCALCGDVLPDGIFVKAVFDDNENFVGVHAETPDGEVVHSCGESVEGGGQHG